MKLMGINIVCIANMNIYHKQGNNMPDVRYFKALLPHLSLYRSYQIIF